MWGYTIESKIFVMLTQKKMEGRNTLPKEVEKLMKQDLG